jgi:hypothetical protein
MFAKSPYMPPAAAAPMRGVIVMQNRSSRKDVGKL